MGTNKNQTYDEELNEQKKYCAEVNRRTIDFLHKLSEIEWDYIFKSSPEKPSMDTSKQQETLAFVSYNDNYTELLDNTLPRIARLFPNSRGMQKIGILDTYRKIGDMSVSVYIITYVSHLKEASDLINTADIIEIYNILDLLHDKQNHCRTFTDRLNKEKDLCKWISEINPSDKEKIAILQI